MNYRLYFVLARPRNGMFAGMAFFYNSAAVSIGLIIQRKHPNQSKRKSLYNIIRIWQLNVVSVSRNIIKPIERKYAVHIANRKHAVTVFRSGFSVNRHPDV
jgi:hypothetical protein